MKNSIYNVTLFSESRLFDNVNTLKNENLQLTLVNERIRFSGAESVTTAGGEFLVYTKTSYFHHYNYS